MKVGTVYRSAKMNDGWNVYHEILSIDGDMIGFCNYGKTTDEVEYKITRKELRYMLRKGMIIEM